jgi:DNA excision repair protein ERCC-3
VGLETNTILSVLNRLSKTQLPTEIEDFVRVSTQNYGKVKLVLQKNRFFLESAYPDVLRKLLKVRWLLLQRRQAWLPGADAPLRRAQDDVISKARIVDDTPAGGGGAGEAGFSVSRAPVEEAAAALAAAADIDGGAGGAGGGTTTAATGDGRELHSFEIDPAQVEHVKQRCLPGELNYPTLEEYDFRADTVNPDVPGLELKPATQVRPYQDKSLSKMFGNGALPRCVLGIACMLTRNRRRARSERHHRAALRRGQVAHRHRCGGAHPQVGAVPVHEQRVR